MDFDALKKASSLFEKKWIPKNSLEHLLDDSSEHYILKSVPDQRKRKICQDIIKSSLLSKIKDGKLLIPSNAIINEIVNHLTPEGVELKNYDVSGSCVTLIMAPTKWFAGLIRPKVWFRFDKVKINAEEQNAVIEYGFDNAILDFAVNDAVGLLSLPYVKNIKRTDFGGIINIDLRQCISDFDAKTYVKRLNCSVFDFVTFSAVQHSISGINFICDQSWPEIVKGILMRLDVIEAQSATVTPSVWMIHRN